MSDVRRIRDVVEPLGGALHLQARVELFNGVERLRNS